MTNEQEQLDAFEAYKAAKLALDADLTFANAKAARAAWWKFLNLFEASTVEPINRDR